MTIVQILNAVKKRIKTDIAASYELQNPVYYEDSDTEGIPQFVNPQVYLGSVPYGEPIPDQEFREHTFPAMIIGFDEGLDDESESFLRIRITFVVYRAGEFDDETGDFSPDMNGYLDLMNMLERTRSSLRKQTVFYGEDDEVQATVQGPIKFGILKDQPWPYWYGYLIFDTDLPVADNEAINWEY